ncbi:52 kDa repressor of the inhibitor of the protein kinase-like [Ditylenchus destructor]|uniref:52 kDa repressor of the inhibitor of the protein kinase-like n=1 Tax=Ditylenchus destructor TaxID=166010 RepID=A0AAD4QWU1_9BILA|nr:52 kDa repressor of the inhibitor of the protein kinase-like [Ditylenchus destructor]
MLQEVDFRIELHWLSSKFTKDFFVDTKPCSNVSMSVAIHSTTDWDSFKEIHEKFLRHIRFALKDRFGDLFEKVGHLQELFPWNSPKTAFESLKPALDFYRNSALDFTDDEFKVQFELWQKFCSNYQGELTFDGAIKFCNKAHFPIIYDLLKIFGITPVTTDIAERSFSSLKLLKTYLRNRIKEERLSSMALAKFIHRISYDVYKVFFDID